MSLKEKLELVDDTVGGVNVKFSYSAGTDVFHFNETHVETALSETDVVERLAEVITNTDVKVSTEYGDNPLNSLRDSELLEDYERGTYGFENFVAETIRDNFYEADLLEESTERFDHKRGYTTLTATLVSDVSEVKNNINEYENVFRGWQVTVPIAGGGSLSFTA